VNRGRGWILCPRCKRRIVRVEHPRWIRHPAYGFLWGETERVVEVAAGAQVLPGVTVIAGSEVRGPTVVICPRGHPFQLAGIRVDLM
jgi:hypothetical protein